MEGSTLADQAQLIVEWESEGIRVESERRDRWFRVACGAALLGLGVVYGAVAFGLGVLFGGWRA